MEAKLEWMSEEEGHIIFYDNGVRFLTAEVFVVGEEEAEIRIQDIVFLGNQTKNGSMCEEVIVKMTECISKCFRLLWEEGMEETVLVEARGTQVAEILDSTPVVQKAYDEYMMKCGFEPQKTTSCGRTSLKLTKTEDGYLCENEDRTFFCRLLTYASEQEGEHCFYLYEVEVDKRKRNKGIATACLTQLFEQMSEHTPLTIFLQVGSYNEPAVHLYKKLGFEVSEALGYYTMEE